MSVFIIRPQIYGAALVWTFRCPNSFVRRRFMISHNFSTNLLKLRPTSLQSPTLTLAEQEMETTPNIPMTPTTQHYVNATVAATNASRIQKNNNAMQASNYRRLLRRRRRNRRRQLRRFWCRPSVLLSIATVILVALVVLVVYVVLDHFTVKSVATPSIIRMDNRVDAVSTDVR